MLKRQQRLKNEKHNVYTENIHKTALSSNNDKRTESIDQIETYAYGINKDLVKEKEKIKYITTIKQYEND